ncbi:hypothetical protein BZA77DRAFT_296673 [Pyronema omphalodes]|nr:hypothetical protein BZA77DRAFT_296673 [Pyronema omphalodes]
MIIISGQILFVLAAMIRTPPPNAGDFGTMHRTIWVRLNRSASWFIPRFCILNLGIIHSKYTQELPKKPRVPVSSPFPGSLFIQGTRLECIDTVFLNHGPDKQKSTAMSRLDMVKKKDPLADAGIWEISEDIMNLWRFIFYVQGFSFSRVGDGDVDMVLLGFVFGSCGCWWDRDMEMNTGNDENCGVADAGGLSNSSRYKYTYAC